MKKKNEKVLVPQCLSILAPSKRAFTLAEGATHVGVFDNCRRCAFTLAEVLITLGIIGVVAAMTIPTLVNKFQQKALDVQFLRAYSSINQALQLTVAEYDYLPQCYYHYAGDNKSTDCDDFWNVLKTKLNVVKTCENKALENGCIPEYAEGFDTLLHKHHQNDEDYDADYWNSYANRNCYSFTKQAINNIRPAYILPNGVILIQYFNNQPQLFAVDINGQKGPNRWGYDLFDLTLRLEKNNSLRYITVGNCWIVEEGGFSSSEMRKRLGLH